MRLNRAVWFSILLASSLAACEGYSRAQEAPANGRTGVQDMAGVHAMLEQNLVKPLAQFDRRRAFSRAAPPAERRVRVLDAALHRDVQGQQYATFALDARWGQSWTRPLFVGCIYPGDGSSYVKFETYYAASVLLGKKAKTAPPTVCQPAPGGA